MVRDISKAELREKYESMSVDEVLKYFGLRYPRELYLLLDEAGIPRKQPKDPVRVRLVD